MKHKVTGKQESSKMCFICGKKNNFGLKASFYETDKNELIAIFKPGQEHQGYPGRLHGGIAAAILDETIGRNINVGRNDELWGVTMEFIIKYKRPIPLDGEIKAITKLTEENKRIFKGTGKIVLSDGKVAATAEGKYLKLPIEKIADFDREENEWKVIVSPDDPEIIEI
ncbi:MAG TPA: PaaI family thioesterase [Actinobacteria bacterium]|nr:PaaI family thioesterase [Actinomycetota bacterium]